MKISAETLQAIENQDRFVQVFKDYVSEVLAVARYAPKLSIQRIVEAHGAWVNDLSRVGVNEPQLVEGLDHFKRCGHLAFWLRRMGPLVDVSDETQNLSDAEGMPLTEDEREFRDLLFGYANEYLAFDFAYQFCLFYEKKKVGELSRPCAPQLDVDYYKIVCHFLKYKSVSPHALYLIYRSLFVG